MQHCFKDNFNIFTEKFCSMNLLSYRVAAIFSCGFRITKP